MTEERKHPVSTTLGDLIEARLRTGTPLPVCPGCKRPIRSTTQAGNRAIIVNGDSLRIEYEYLVCTRCMAKADTPSKQEILYQRCERRVDRDPVKFATNLSAHNYASTAGAAGFQSYTLTPEDEIPAEDGVWFAAHPDRTCYVRKTLPAEIRNGWSQPLVVVKQVAPGRRIRGPWIGALEACANPDDATLSLFRVMPENYETEAGASVVWDCLNSERVMTLGELAVRFDSYEAKGSVH